MLEYIKTSDVNISLPHTCTMYIRTDASIHKYNTYSFLLFLVFITVYILFY